jgi:ATP-binding cassette subfamily B protein
MVGMATQLPLYCARLLAIHLSLLALTLIGLRIIGWAVDVVRHAAAQKQSAEPIPHPPERFVGLSFDFSAAEPINLLWAFGGAIFLIASARLLLRYFAATFSSKLVQTILTELRRSVYDKLQRLSFRFFDANETGSIINRATSDVNAMATFAQNAIIDVTVLAITLVVYFFFMMQLNPLLTLLALATSPVLVGGSIWFSKVVRPAHEENRRLYDRLIRTLSENVQGQHVVKGFARQDEEIEKFHRANDAYRVQQRWLFKRGSLYNNFIVFLTQTNLMIVLLYGGHLVIRHRNETAPAFSIGDLVIFVGLLQAFSNQVAQIANLADQLQSSLAAAGRVYEVLGAPLEIDSRPDAKPLPKAKGDVRFENVTFGYRAAEPVLRNVSFHAKPGECVAILGATGSGKSTLLSLITRFYDPQEGRVLIDGADARELDLDDLRHSIGLVFQESFLFSNTIAANIAFGKPTATREEVIKAAKIAAADGFISKLPQGYDTVIGEQGLTLSGGQRQRLAIARAVLLEPSILILDDATAAIDPETEHEILLAMDNAMKGRTTFVVAHRLSTLRRADRVIVLGGGRIVQSGTHEELMEAEGHYSEVARMQLVDEESQRLLDRGHVEVGTAPVNGNGHR